VRVRKSKGGILDNIIISGVFVKELPAHHDNRGWLIELYREDECNGQWHRPVMNYISQTLPGVIRGPHEHKYQTDYFAFVGPSNFDLYLWDARSKVETYQNKMVIRCGQDQPRAIIIPPGVVHAYKNVGDTPGWVFNAPDKLYAGYLKREPVDEIRHELDDQSPYYIE